MELNFLIGKRETLIARANDLLQRAETDQRALTAEELTQHADLISEVGGIDATLKSRDAHTAAEVAASQTAKAGRSLTPGVATESAEERGTKSPAYHAAFMRFVRGDNSAGAELRAHTVATDTAGGYLVPDEWFSKIISKRNEINFMRGLATVINTSRGDLNLPRETSTGTAGWTTEGGAFPETEDVFGNFTLTPYKLARLCKVSEELLTDEAFDLEGYLAMTFAKAFAEAEETAFINGDGSAKPTGIIRSSTTGATAAATNAITFDELYDLFFSVKPAYRKNAVWLMADSTRKTLAQIKTGVASDKRYLWQAELSNPVESSLFGRPVISASNMPAIATGTNVVAFGDMSYYYIADKKGIGVQRLNELYAASGLVGFRAFQRTDGELSQAEAVKHLRTA